MDLRRALRVDTDSRVAFVGAGGKTTAMFQLAHQLPQPVLVTTTTHLGDWQIPLADHHRIIDANDASWIDEVTEHNSGVWLLTGPPTGDHRYTGPSSNSLLQIRCATERHNWPVLIEADGSRQKPIKMPADYEPAIPDWVNHVVVVCGLSGLNKPLSADWFHRSELATELLKLESGSALTADHLTAILTHPLGGLKNIPVGCQRSALLNQADELEDKSVLGELPRQLTSAYHRAFTASLKQKVIGPVYERTAAIILAAGAASRFGSPKVLLNWDGIPFIRRVTLTALESGLDPVVVVLGSNDTQIRSALNDLNVVIVHNSEWQTGQSSSVRLGVLLAEKYGCGGAFFLLADQPQVTTSLINSLIDLRTRTLATITAPMIAGRRGNPVIFDQSLFDALAALQGDAGGRLLFASHPVEYLPWEDEAMLLDVDTMADYETLQSIYSKR